MSSTSSAPGSSPIPRRRFLKASLGSFVLVSGGAGLCRPVWSSASDAVLLPSTTQKVMLQTLTHAVFASHLGSTFRLESAPNHFLALTLVEAIPLAQRGPTSGGDRTQPFSILFDAPAGADLSQGTYTLHHETLGRFDLFLVPIGRNGDGGRLRCEAIFN